MSRYPSGEVLEFMEREWEDGRRKEKTNGREGRGK